MQKKQKELYYMKDTLEQIRREALSAMESAQNAQELDALRVKYLGKRVS